MKTEHADTTLGKHFLTASYPEQPANLWSRSDAKPYRKHDVKGECIPLVATVDLSNLPWDDAPIRPLSGEHDSGLLCVKRSQHRCVLTFTITDAMGHENRLYVKRCKPSRSPLKQLSTIGRKSKSRREWELGWDLLERDIPTAVPLLWADQRKHGQVKATYFISLGLEETVPFRSLHKSLQTESRRIAWIALLGAFIRQAHDKGFAHDDLRADHVFVAFRSLELENHEHPQFFFIDLDGSRVYDEAIKPYRRAHNFFQIFRSIPEKRLSEDQRRAFFNGYSDGKLSDTHIDSFERAISLVRFQKRLGRFFKLKIRPKRK